MSLTRRKGATTLLLVAGLCVVPLLQAKRRIPSVVERLVRLYEERRYFELRDALASFETDHSPEVEFFRGVVDQAFNRPEAAVLRLRALLEATRDAPPNALTKESLALLADAYRRLGRYGEAAACFREALGRLGPRIRAAERASYENQAEAWSSLAGVAPLAVEVTADVTIRMTQRLIPVRIGERAFLVGYDTGANMSVLLESMADELAVRIVGPVLRIQTGTGDPVEGRLGIVPEMSLGPILVKNAVFIVLADRLFPPSKAGSGVERRGLLGLPVLAALKEFTETALGEFIVPARPRSRTSENMCLHGSMPVVEAVHRGVRLRLCLDTGAAVTFLFAPYYRRFRAEIDRRSMVRKDIVRSVGGSRVVPVRFLDEFAFRAGDKHLALRRVMVQTQVTQADTRYFDGTIGVDILSLCSRMTLNFDSMAFILE